MNRSRAIGANSWEEILRLKPMNNFFQALSISCEKDGPCSRTVPNSDNVALNKFGTIWRSREWLVIVAGAVRVICDRVLVISYES